MIHAKLNAYVSTTTHGQLIQQVQHASPTLLYLKFPQYASQWISRYSPSRQGAGLVHLHLHSLVAFTQHFHSLIAFTRHFRVSILRKDVGSGASCFMDTLGPIVVLLLIAAINMPEAAVGLMWLFILFRIGFGIGYCYCGTCCR